MSRAYAIFSSLCLSPALLCSLEPSATGSEVPQVLEIQPTEASVTVPNPDPRPDPNGANEIQPTEASVNREPSSDPQIDAAEMEPHSTEDDSSQEIDANAQQINPIESSDIYCGCTPHPQRIEVSHVEGKGIGYKKGYTTLEGFFVVPSTLENDWVPFLDIRGHVFNDGHPAANAGLGLRYLSSRVWGANIYYDYRKTSRVHYNQIGAGLETLGNVWDFRINGYFPVGKRESGSYRFKFDHFKGHRMILKSKKEFAMIGGNAEVGAHAYHSRKMDLYAAAGPYYFAGHGRSTWGGERRLAFTGFNFLRLQVSGS